MRRHIRTTRKPKFDLVAYNDAADKANADIYPKTINVVPLYTPVTRVPEGPSQEEKDEKQLVLTVRKLITVLFREDEQRAMRRAARDGVRLFNYLYNATKAAEDGAMAPFPGLTIEPVTVTTTSERGKRAMAVCELINTTVMSVLDYRERVGKDRT